MRARTFLYSLMIVLVALSAVVVLAGVVLFNAGVSDWAAGVLSVNGTLLAAQEMAAQAIQWVAMWLSDHYQRVPTLLLGLVALVLFPIISLLSALIRSLSAPIDDVPSTGAVTARTTTHSFASDASGRRASRERGAALPKSDRAACNAGQPVWPSKAMVELRDPGRRGHPSRILLSQPVVQIGRSEDVDIVIHDPTVHRHHATIHCTEDAEYMVTDMSAGTGNGVVVNGLPVVQHQIFNGDEIRLGRARLMFLTAQT